MPLPNIDVGFEHYLVTLPPTSSEAEKQKRLRCPFQRRIILLATSWDICALFGDSLDRTSNGRLLTSAGLPCGGAFQQPAVKSSDSCSFCLENRTGFTVTLMALEEAFILKKTEIAFACGFYVKVDAQPEDSGN